MVSVGYIILTVASTNGFGENFTEDGIESASWQQNKDTNVKNEQWEVWFVDNLWSVGSGGNLHMEY